MTVRTKRSLVAVFAGPSGEVPTSTRALAVLLFVACSVLGCVDAIALRAERSKQSAQSLDENMAHQMRMQRLDSISAPQVYLDIGDYDGKVIERRPDAPEPMISVLRAFPGGESLAS